MLMGLKTWKTSHLQAKLARIPREKVVKVEKRRNYLILMTNLTRCQQKRGRSENLLRKLLSLSWMLDRCSISMKNTASKY